MSWTTDIEQARWFADYRALGRAEGSNPVFKAVVDPGALLAIPGKLGRGLDGTDAEAEVIVNPDLLPPLPRSAIAEEPRDRAAAA